jgi:hypothetical protein
MPALCHDHRQAEDRSRSHQQSGPIISCTIPPKPRFESGKSYRTREGWIVKLREFDAGSVYPLGGMFDRVTGNHWWTFAGRWCHWNADPHARDLMAGAIEDEPEAVDPAQEYGFHTQLANLRKDMAAQVNVIAGMTAKIEAYHHRMEGMDHEGETTRERADAAALGYERIAPIQILDFTEGDGL